MAVRGLRAGLGAARPRGMGPGCAAGLRSASEPSDPGPEPAGPATAALYVHVSVGAGAHGDVCTWGAGLGYVGGFRSWRLRAGTAGTRGVPLPRARRGCSVRAKGSTPGCGWWALGVRALCVQSRAPSVGQPCAPPTPCARSGPTAASTAPTAASTSTWCRRWTRRRCAPVWCGRHKHCCASATCGGGCPPWGPGGAGSFSGRLQPPNPPRSVTSVFFGGGTPSLAAPRTIAAVLEAAAEVAYLPAGAEVTLEANPGSADPARLSGFRAAGVNRLSLGVQVRTAAPSHPNLCSHAAPLPPCSIRSHWTTLSCGCWAGSTRRRRRGRRWRRHGSCSLGAPPWTSSLGCRGRATRPGHAAWRRRWGCVTTTWPCTS